VASSLTLKSVISLDTTRWALSERHDHPVQRRGHTAGGSARSLAETLILEGSAREPRLALRGMEPQIYLGMETD